MPMRCATSTPELAGHEAGADDADEGDRRRLDLGHSDRSLGALLHEVERVERRCQLGAQSEIGERFVLGGEAVVDGPVLRRAEQLESASRGGWHVLGSRCDDRRHARDGSSGVPSVSVFGRCDGDLALDDGRRPCQRLLDEVSGLEHRVGNAKLDAPASVSSSC